MVILYAYPCIGLDKSLFWQQKYTKDGCKGKKPSHRKKPSFVYLCIGVSGQRNHSLMPSCAWCTLCVHSLVCGGNEFCYNLKPMLPVCFCHGPPLQVAGCRSVLNCVLAQFGSLPALCTLATEKRCERTQSEQNLCTTAWELVEMTLILLSSSSQSIK